jgi:hypothetical protein
MFDYAKQKPLHEYIAYFEDRKGSIAVYDDGIVLKMGRTETPIRFGYVQSIEKSGLTAVLGKIDVKIVYFSLFGNREEVSAKMREADCNALKQDAGK